MLEFICGWRVVIYYDTIKNYLNMLLSTMEKKYWSYTALISRLFEKVLVFSSGPIN